MEDHRRPPRERQVRRADPRARQGHRPDQGPAAQDRGEPSPGPSSSSTLSARSTPDPSGVEEFLKLAPKDPRAADLLGTAVSVTRDEKKKAALLERLNTEFPDSDLVGNDARSPQQDGIDRQAVPPCSSPTRSTGPRSRSRNSRARSSSSISGRPGAGPASPRCPR